MWRLRFLLLPAAATVGGALEAVRTTAAARDSPGVPAAAQTPPAVIISHAVRAKADRASRVTGPDLAASEAKALAAEQKAAAAVQEIQRLSDENNAVVPLVQGQRAEAGVALKTAQDATAEAERIVAETKVATEAAAKQAAQEYLLEIKQAGAKAMKDSAAARAAAESKAELAAAKATAKAGEKYHTAILRGQKIQHEYMSRARQLAAASNALKEQAFVLQNSAQQYQWMKEPMIAQQMQIQAASIMNEGERYKQEALSLKSVADKVGGLIPAYDEAEQAAEEQAMDNASGASLPEVDVPYLLQRGDVRVRQPSGRALRGTAL